MFKKIKIIMKTIYFRLISPNKIAKIVGVNFGNNCNFMTKNFGSEPYLIKMGDNVRTAGGVNFITHNGLAALRKIYPEHKNADFFGTIVIGNNVMIGLGVTLLPNTKIGDNVIVGAGSLVRGELRSNSIYAGVPVKYICTIDEFKNKNENNFDHTKHLGTKDKELYLRKKYNIEDKR